MLKKLSLYALERYRDHGLLVLRLGLGISFMVHGWGKLTGGEAKLTAVGGAMKNVGLDFAPYFWGICAALSEFAGGLFFAIGLFTRPMAILLTFTMFIAWLLHVVKGDSFGKFSHAMEAGIVFLGMIFIGPGRFSLDHKLFAEREEEESSQ